LSDLLNSDPAIYEDLVVGGDSSESVFTIVINPFK
jgi:hypothetical protein